MTVSAGKMAGALMLLVGVWIAVYWWWEPKEPRITFSGAPAAATAAPPRLEPPVPAPVQSPVPKEPPLRMAERPQSAPPAATPRVVAPAPRPAVIQPDKQAAPAVKPPRFWEYTVNGGETLQTISMHFYRTTAYAPAIARANPLMDPTKLRAGRVIRIPEDPNNIQGLPQTDIKPAPPKPTEIRQATPQLSVKATKTPESAPPAAKRTYRVQEGDTLSEISQKFYGSHGRTKLIFEANRDKLKSEDDLRVGAELVIPEAPPERKSNG